MRLRDRMIRATPTTITEPATTWSGVIVSFSTIEPRMTATTGFTNAYVAISGNGAWCRTQAYAVNATRLPTSVR